MAQLLIGNQWRMDEIEQYLKRRWETQVKVKHNDAVAGMYDVRIGTWHAFLHSQKRTPIGNCILIMADAGDRTDEVFRDMMEFFGGFYKVRDTDETFFFDAGKFNPEDGLTFFARSAILDGLDPDDRGKGFVEYMKMWDAWIAHRGPPPAKALKGEK